MKRLHQEGQATTTRPQHLQNHSIRPHHEVKEQIDHQTQENQAGYKNG